MLYQRGRRGGSCLPHFCTRQISLNSAEQVEGDCLGMHRKKRSVSCHETSNDSHRNLENYLKFHTKLNLMETSNFMLSGYIGIGMITITENITVIITFPFLKFP